MLLKKLIWIFTMKIAVDVAGMSMEANVKVNTVSRIITSLKQTLRNLTVEFK